MFQDKQPIFMGFYIVHSISGQIFPKPPIVKCEGFKHTSLSIIPKEENSLYILQIEKCQWYFTYMHIDVLRLNEMDK